MLSEVLASRLCCINAHSYSLSVSQACCSYTRLHLLLSLCNVSITHTFESIIQLLSRSLVLKIVESRFLRHPVARAYPFSIRKAIDVLCISLPSS